MWVRHKSAFFPLVRRVADTVGIVPRAFAVYVASGWTVSAAFLGKDCKSAKCKSNLTNKKLCLLAQKATKQMTGYFGGYSSNMLPIGQKELKHMHQSLERKIEVEKLENMTEAFKVSASVWSNT